MNPLITTVIPTYRRPHLLKRAIESVLRQTFPHFQIFVYDNCSEDATRDLVLEMAAKDPRIQYYGHQKHLHAIANFQYGMGQVKTPFFSILADDDLLLPDFYTTGIEMLSRFPTAQFFVGSAIDMHQQGKVISANALKWDTKEYWEPPEGLYEIITKYINWTGTLFRKEVLQYAQLDPTLTAIDFDFVCRLGAQFPFVFSPKPCALFIHHPASYSSYCGSKLVWPGWNKTTENLMAIPSLTEESKTKVRKLMRESLKAFLLRLAIKATMHAQFAAAQKSIQLYAQEFPDRQGTAGLIKMLLSLCRNNHWLLACSQRLFTAALDWKRRPLQRLYGELVDQL